MVNPSVSGTTSGLRTSFVWEKEIWDNFIAVLNRAAASLSSTDYVIWTGSPDGQYYPKRFCEIVSSADSAEEQVWNLVWAKLAPPKVESFIWKAVHGRVPMLVELLKRGVAPNDSPNCVLCCKEAESIAHLFFHYELACQAQPSTNLEVSLYGLYGCAETKSCLKTRNSPRIGYSTLHYFESASVSKINGLKRWHLNPAEFLVEIENPAEFLIEIENPAEFLVEIENSTDWVEIENSTEIWVDIENSTDWVEIENSTELLNPELLQTQQLDHVPGPDRLNWAGSSDAPPKVVGFVWKAVHRRVSVTTELVKRGVCCIENVLCIFCNSAPETIEHVLWNEFTSVLNRAVSSVPGLDRLNWAGSPDGNYSPKSFCSKLDSAGKLKDSIWIRVWSKLATPKVAGFVWKAVHRRVPVTTELVKRGVRCIENVLCMVFTENKKEISSAMATRFDLGNMVVQE
ncbi:hypothetical protein F3Y22_tig00116971pilonHSYRG00100 [Hibiscus syriacus]|uniref:Reverse transcriptase zinc-binding domain-containing protein n=1 Tax=Hibiscus syriacus TaxID=106335 RepID=A0A6A2XIL3_HIBSY|nr:hypothetical protein F3Y22_tig00116971pilonHSYRG00100 [Hibiscus syriacus]